MQIDERRDAQPGPGAQAATEALMALATLTEGLDAQTLTIAVMSHVDGLTQEEIAEAMELSRRTVGKKLKRFLEHTRQRARLEDEEGA